MAEGQGKVSAESINVLNVCQQTDRTLEVRNWKLKLFH